jgi:hypothetical protein
MQRLAWLHARRDQLAITFASVESRSVMMSGKTLLYCPLETNV